MTGPGEAARVNPLVPALLKTINVARKRAEELRELRAVLSAAIDLLRACESELDALRAGNLNLRAQLRALVAGRTIAAERQALERERLDAEIDARFAQRHHGKVA